MVIARYLGRMLVMPCALSLASTAQARNAGDESGEIICLSVAQEWGGTSDDVAHISSVAVPQSFQRLYFGDPCTRYSLVKSSLIDWNLAFGNEASTTAALEFLEAQTTAGKPVIADLAQRLTAARRDAQHDIVAASAILRQPDGMQHRGALVRKSKSLERLRSMIDVRNDYTFLAGQYLRAAEFYGSPSLLARARRYAAPALDAMRITRTLAAADVAAKLDTVSPLESGDYRDLASSDLEMRMAVVSASLSRDPEDLAAAATVLTSYYVPFYKVAADEAFSHGDSFCDIGERSDLADYAQACKSDNFERRAIAWWRYRAQLDLLGTGAPDLLDSLYTTTRLIERDYAAHHDQQYRFRYDAAADQIVTLHLASADAFIRSASPEAGGWTNGGGDAAIQSLDAALNELSLAERSAPASQTPGRFRQIATRFLSIRARRAALENPEYYLGFERQAAYFSAVLAALDDIALGRAAKQ